MENRHSPALGLILIAIGIFIAVSLLSYHPGDAAAARGDSVAYNYCGGVGAELALALYLVLGAGALAIPLLILAEGLARLLPRRRPLRPVVLKFLYGLFIVAGLSPLLNLQSTFPAAWLGEQLEGMGLGGWWGGVATAGLAPLGPFGSRLVLLTMVLVPLALLTELKPVLVPARALGAFFRGCGKFFVRREKAVPSAVSPGRPFRERGAAPPAVESLARQRALLLKQREEEEKKSARERVREERRRDRERQREEKEALRRRQEEEKRARGKKQTRPATVRERAEGVSAPRREKARPAVAAVPSGAPASSGESAPYQLPPLEILDDPPPLSEREIKNKSYDESGILESTLEDFGIESRVVGIERGPAITRYELQIAPGVKVGKVKALDNDIALTMKAKSVRILAPIPGKAAIGIEVPNTNTTLVYMREMIESPEFKKGRHVLPLTIGKDISGTPIVADLTAMPHLLIAGATGSGKTVCINSIIVSFLFSRTPDELKLIMVDPKKVEMASFHRLPHLLCPVITDAGQAALALAWVLKEMEDRYDLCARVGVRNITAYNASRRAAAKAAKGGEPEDELPASMPYIVLLIDELADLMLVAAKEIETAIARLAHLSRAVGIHLILATQRPSVDVITGIIKANLPSRISFKVAAKVDSRTVLDAGGADKLLGNGDLLFLPPATDQLIRAQGTFCHDHEINNVVAFVTRQRSPSFEKEMFRKKAPGIDEIEDGEGSDELIGDAIDVIRKTDQASVSMLQRKLKIGYSRAARVMDQLEEKGVVGPYKGTKARDILIGTYAGDGAPLDEEDEEE
jgi:DNA segregation ATPase FtsK/SpoIIIE, S-DNA-T family